MGDSLRQVEIKDGEFCLDGLVLTHPRILTVKTLQVDMGSLRGCKKQEVWMKEISNQSPEGANYYLIGNTIANSSATGNCSTLLETRAVLYLSAEQPVIQPDS